MEIRVSRSEFLTELVPMQGIVERRTTIPVLSHLLLRAEDGKLHIAATDLEVSLTSSCDGEVKESGSIAIQAKKLLEIMRAAAGEDDAPGAVVAEGLVDEARARRLVRLEGRVDHVAHGGEAPALVLLSGEAVLAQVRLRVAAELGEPRGGNRHGMGELASVATHRRVCWRCHDRERSFCSCGTSAGCGR